nr:hypothetical protein [Tanacetum cinerariifolium]
SSVIIIRTDNGTEFKNQVLKEYFDTVGISHQMPSVRTPQQNGVVERQNQTLVEAARTMLIFSHAPLFLWAGRLLLRVSLKTAPLFTNDREDIGKLGAKGYIGFFIGYSADSCAYRVYNRQAKKIIETINVSFDELSAMVFEQRSSKPGIQSMTSGHISSGLDLTYAPQPSATGRTVPPAQEPQVRQSSTASTTIANTALIPTNLSSHAINVLISLQNVDELNPNAIVDGNTFVNPFANSSTSAAASSSSNQLRSDGNMCMYALTVSIMEPKNVKEAMTDPAWIESMQEVLLQFKRLDVWVLVPTPDNISPLTLKWLFKNKHDEEQTVIRNKSHLVVRGYRQEEGIDFEESFGFIDDDHPSHVYKLKKALYGLKQSPRAWYDKLSKFLLQNHFFKGTIDPTLFIRRFQDDILVVQVYVDDIIFGSTHPRPDIVHATCLCARYQAKPTEKHLKEVKRIFWYLRGTVNTGLWYMKDSGFELTGFSDVDYAGCKDTFKSTSGGAQFLAIAISCNPVQHSRTKHIAVRYHFIKEHVEKVTIELYFVKTDYQLADIFTKALLADRFNYLVCRLARAGGIYPGTLPLDRVEVLGSVDGVTTSLQLSQNSRPPMLDHQDKYMMKAQVHVLKSSTISDEQPLPQRKHYCQIYQVVKHMLRGRLLASFQDREHEGGDTRSQGGINDNDLKI